MTESNCLENCLKWRLHSQQTNATLWWKERTHCSRSRKDFHHTTSTTHNAGCSPTRNNSSPRFTILLTAVDLCSSYICQMPFFVCRCCQYFSPRCFSRWKNEVKQQAAWKTLISLLKSKVNVYCTVDCSSIIDDLWMPCNCYNCTTL